jgi:hypothetical protein
VGPVAIIALMVNFAPMAAVKLLAHKVYPPPVLAVVSNWIMILGIAVSVVIAVIHCKSAIKEYVDALKVMSYVQILAFKPRSIPITVEPATRSVQLNNSALTELV